MPPPLPLQALQGGEGRRGGGREGRREGEVEEEEEEEGKHTL
jgi:hypothetical protein